MIKRYFLSADGSSALSVGDGPLGAAVVPSGYHEVTAAEYTAAVEAGRQVADERAAAFIANDGAVPEDQEQDAVRPVPVGELETVLAAP